MRLRHAITGSKNKNSANCEVDFWLAIRHYELRKVFNFGILLFSNMGVCLVFGPNVVSRRRAALIF